ncbi:hypothetical protein Lal_00009212 [Lupinus albus]|nr:hypothetical protein Lal_00009212 [Lupinus albus]
MVDDSQDTTHFGFQTVAKAQKADMVAHVFHSVAAKYDVMNDLMSFGIHRLWKRFTIDCSGVRRGQTVLDLAGGTGDLTAKFSRLVGETGRVVLADINDSMLKMGREKLRNIGVVGNVEYVQANAEALPFPDNTFDCITISFGLRNVTDKEKALRSMYRVLKPGGRLLVLEFSKPIIEPLSKAYDAYSFHVLPRIGELVANDAESYRYLAESIRMHPDQDTLKAMMQDAEFENVEYFNLTAGVVALHRALKVARQRLNGKVLRIVLKEFSTPLVLVFSERQLDVLGAWEGDADCSVITHMSVLPKLRDRQQLTALIRSGELEVEGDIQVVQNFVALTDLAEFDPAELLAPFIGDIAAEGIGKVLHGGASFARKSLLRQQRYAAEVLTEEWRMAPGPLEVAWFAEETAAVERAVDALTKRLEKLEGK